MDLHPFRGSNNTSDQLAIQAKCQNLGPVHVLDLKN